MSKNAVDLVNFLRASGTGKSKLVKAEAIAINNPDAPAAEIVQAIIDCGCGDGTIRKCEEFMGGLSLQGEMGDLHRPQFPTRAPIGGCRIQGQDFQAGAIIPEALVSAATPGEMEGLCVQSSGLEVRPIPGAIPAAEKAWQDKYRELETEFEKRQAAADKRHAELVAQIDELLAAQPATPPKVEPAPAQV